MKKEQELKSKVKGALRKCKNAAWMSSAFLAMSAQSVLAATPTPSGTGSTVITQGFQSLMDVVTALVSAIGAIVLLWGFFEWGISMQSRDGTEQSNAFKRIGGGLVMVLAPQLINIFLV